MQTLMNHLSVSALSLVPVPGVKKDEKVNDVTEVLPLNKIDS